MLSAVLHKFIVLLHKLARKDINVNEHDSLSKDVTFNSYSNYPISKLVNSYLYSFVI